MRAWQIPLRLATGAFILNSGLERRKADAQAAERIQGFAAGAYPAVKRLEPEQFAKAFSAAEIAVGATLLSPFVSPATAGLVLGGFSGTLLNLYWKTPGVHRDGDPRPTPEGVPLAKDVWLAGAAAALLLGSVGGGSRKRKRAKAKAKAKAQTTVFEQVLAARAAKVAHAAAATGSRARKPAGQVVHTAQQAGSRVRQRVA